MLPHESSCLLLDPFTVHVCDALVNLAFAAILALMWSRSRKEYLLFWALSLLLVVGAGLGFTVVHDRTLIGVLYGLVAANVTLIFAGARVFQDRRPFDGWIVMLPILVTVTYWTAAVLGQSALGSVGVSVLLAVNVGLVGRYCMLAASRSGLGLRIVGWSLIAYAPLYLLSATIVALSYGTAKAAEVALMGDLALNCVFLAGIIVHIEEEARHALKRLAMQDPLTGTLNRAGLFAKLADKGGRDAAMLLVDLDHFKSINDTWGHAAGDAVLKEFVGRATALLAQNDVIGRLGGEEFVLCLHHADREAAAMRAEAIRRALSDCPVIWSGQEIRVTASIGVAVWSPTETAEAVIRRADEALYRAKHAGRDQVAA